MRCLLRKFVKSVLWIGLFVVFGEKSPALKILRGPASSRSVSGEIRLPSMSGLDHIPHMLLCLNERAPSALHSSDNFERCADPSCAPELFGAADPAVYASYRAEAIASRFAEIFDRLDKEGSSWTAGY